MFSAKFLDIGIFLSLMHFLHMKIFPNGLCCASQTKLTKEKPKTIIN